MWKTISILFFSIIIIIVIKFNKLRLQQSLQKKKTFLKTLEQVNLTLETCKINGFDWQESIPVDSYDNELDSNNTAYSHHFLLRNFHKQKKVYRFKTQIIAPIRYHGKTYQFSFELPIEDTIIRMAFYTNKEATVYVEQNKLNEIRFYLDFSFLNHPDTPIIVSKYFK